METERKFEKSKKNWLREKRRLGTGKIMTVAPLIFLPIAGPYSCIVCS